MTKKRTSIARPYDAAEIRRLEALYAGDEFSEMPLARVLATLRAERAERAKMAARYRGLLDSAPGLQAWLDGGTE